MKKNETKKSVRRFYAGDVIRIEFTGESRPCDIAMAMLMKPFSVVDGHYTGDMATTFGIDVANKRFIGNMSYTSGRIEKVTGREKAMFFKIVYDLAIVHEV